MQPQRAVPILEEVPHQDDDIESPQTNAELVLRARPGSRLAAELALGSSDGWIADARSLVFWPAALVLVSHLFTTYVPWARPSDAGLLLGTALAFVAARTLGRAAPRALARVRRVPIALLTLAAGGLGACVGGGAAACVAVMSPWLHRPDVLVVAGASFGLAYAGLLFVPLLLARLGRASRATLSAAQALALVLAFAYAGWSATCFA